MKGSLPRRRWLWFLPSALLILVAVNQVWLAYSEDLSPWKGGGFGMFASTDTSGARHLHPWSSGPGSGVRFRSPSRWQISSAARSSSPPMTASANLHRVLPNSQALTGGLFKQSNSSFGAPTTIAPP